MRQGKEKSQEKWGNYHCGQVGLHPMGDLLGDDGNTPQVIEQDGEAGALVHQLASTIGEDCPRSPDFPHLGGAPVEGKAS